MGKNNKHKKQLKSEKAKVKLKTKGSKILPKGLNITDASFKVKKIVIREQLKCNDDSQILSRRKLNVKDLLTRLQHYNSSVRQDAIRELKEILLKHSINVLSVQLNLLIKGISALSLDKEKAIRREALKTLDLVLNAVSQDHLIPFSDILISYLTCAMTHIDQNIMEDSLLFLDVLIKYCKNFLASKSHKILVYFLDMISKLCSQSQPGRQLTTNLHTKSTSMKWRIKVLNSLQQFLSIVVQTKKCKTNSLINLSKKYYINEGNTHFPIYSPISLQVSSINTEKTGFKSNKYLNLETLQDYVDSLIPLILDSWIEVCPKRQICGNTQLPLTNEAVYLLKCITSIIQSIIQLIELLEEESGTTVISTWFKNKFQNIIIKNLLIDFPYIQQKSCSRTKNHLKETTGNLLDDCLEQNLTLCYIYIWFTMLPSIIKENKLNTNLSLQILAFINEKLENWTCNQNHAVPHLIKALRILFIEANFVWYKNNISLGNILKRVINAYFNISKGDLQIQLFEVLKEIVMNQNLSNLHGENEFKKFIKTLPALLLETEINDSTVQMLNRVVLQYSQWIKKELEENYTSIIENAKVIKIIGSENEQNTRLMICNLFYFMDGQVYY